ncbi:hypothetical protein L228DRAFT_244801 [Xylona heveae TC161]|uniref:ThuA-like domain-containing protein n=1 Tax=Xylona heveae (strain CBS 132557 / TC161) TaxID=1328760 RepID=A0A165HUG5_XYLHT|nr:hypothetical protein L228DRAFT_244801 [Xylona heveae TC161]KZF23941.1 hypothetical protein L228DRAFT_244801 [Xylona heveae TC161]
MSAQAQSASANSTLRPTILLLSLEKESFWEEQYSDLVKLIGTDANIVRLTKADGALDYLTNNTPSAILVTDPAMVKRKPSFSVVSQKVVEYVRNGGTAVLATHFSSFVRPNDLGQWFQRSWGLPWIAGDYHRTTVQLNHDCSSPRLEQAEMLKEYSQKAVFLKNVPKDAALYLPSSDSRTESFGFPASPVDTSQVPVVFAKVGNGRLGYVGDVNNEWGSVAVVLYMIGLNPEP